MTDPTSEMSIVEIAQASVLAEQVLQLVTDRAEVEWFNFCLERQGTPSDIHLIGILKGLMKNRPISFRWAMYVISIHRGCEELLAKFFIALYQTEPTE